MTAGKAEGIDVMSFRRNNNHNVTYLCRIQITFNGIKFKNIFYSIMFYETFSV